MTEASQTGKVLITVKIKVPDGPTCNYPPKEGYVRGFSCQWKYHHTGARKAWCRIFDDADVSDNKKCAECLNLLND